MMHSEQRELFRIALLRVLDSNNTQYGLELTALAVLVSRYGFRVKPEEVATEILYLADKQHVALVVKTISPENRAWRITADGRDYLAING